MKNILYTIALLLFLSITAYGQGVTILPIDENRKAQMDDVPQDGVNYQIDLAVTGIPAEDMSAMIAYMNRVPFVTFSNDGNNLRFTFDTNHSHVNGWNMKNWDFWLEGFAARIRYVEANGFG